MRSYPQLESSIFFPLLIDVFSIQVNFFYSLPVTLLVSLLLILFFILLLVSFFIFLKKKSLNINNGHGFFCFMGKRKGKKEVVHESTKKTVGIRFFFFFRFSSFLSPTFYSIFLNDHRTLSPSPNALDLRACNVRFRFHGPKRLVPRALGLYLSQGGLCCVTETWTVHVSLYCARGPLILTQFGAVVRIEAEGSRLTPK